jgi:hypothetical protein
MIKKNFFSILFIFVFFACLFIIQGSAKKTDMNTSPKKYDIEYRMKEGTSLVIDYSQKDQYTREILGNALSEEQEDIFACIISVKEIKNNNMGLELEIKKMAQLSGDPQSGAGPDFSSLTGKKVFFDLTHKGQLINFEGLHNLPEIYNQARQITITQDVYKSLITSIFPALPENPVEEGNTWKSHQVYSLKIAGGEVQVENDHIYTLLGETVHNGIPCLKFGADFTTTVKGNGQVQAMNFKMDMQGEGTQTIFFSHEQGMIISIGGTSEVKGEAVFEEADMSMPMNHKYKTKIDFRTIK